jgi:enoyl-CoA hydratase
VAGHRYPLCGAVGKCQRRRAARAPVGQHPERDPAVLLGDDELEVFPVEADTKLFADLVVIAEDARIGYMPARVWGCPTTAMWVYRIGAERAKRMLLTGDTIDGVTAASWGLGESVPAADLDAAVEKLADRLAGVPTNQLVMQKLMINQAYDNMGLQGTQLLATLFDGIARHTPEGHWFKDLAEREGFHAAVEWRDSGRPIPNGGIPNGG